MIALPRAFGRHSKWILAALILVSLLLAWRNRFIQDDAFISFRYAENLVEGRGLSWNEGERVEGYTNFLWVLIVALPISLGLDPVLCSQLIGLGVMVATILATYHLALELLGAKPHALLSTALLGTNYTFSAYGTSGLETQLQACLLVSTAWLTLRVLARRDWRPPHLAGISLLAAAALLTRLDSAVCLLIPAVALLIGVCRDSVSKPTKLTRLALLSLPVALLLLTWFGWKLSYYGSLLPNSFFAKTANPSNLFGLKFGFRFLTSYFLVPFVLLAVVALWEMIARLRWSWIALVGMLTSWSLYVVYVGGDFMEFRFFVPILPPAFVLITWLAVRFVQRHEVRIALVALVFAGSIHHGITFERKSPGGIESISEMRSHLESDHADWDHVGRRLGELFGGVRPPITIATSAAGAIPYYSGLPTIDMHGLNHRWTDRQSRIVSYKPGHHRLVTVDHLLERNVNLLLGPPRVGRRETDRQSPFRSTDLGLFEIHPDDHDRVPRAARLLEIPLDDRLQIEAIYLVPHASIDAMVDSGSLGAAPILVP